MCTTNETKGPKSQSSQAERAQDVVHSLPITCPPTPAPALRDTYLIAVYVSRE